MIIFGIILCVLSVLVTFKRYRLVLFGQRATGEIVGYGNYSSGRYGVKSCCYKIKYEFEGKEYIAESLEGVSAVGSSTFNDNLHENVTVCFNPKNPERVTVKEFRQAENLGLGLFLAGQVIIILTLLLY